MNIHAARRYHTPRNGPLSLDQAETRRLAYALKDPRAAAEDFDTAGREMAALIQGPCWLIPIPSSTGDTTANAKLANAIAQHCPGAQVVAAIRRTQPVPSQCARHKAGLGPIPADQHHLTRTPRMLTLRQTYFVDNVTTSGHTFQAAHNAMSFGTGLAFADAFNPNNR